MFKPFVFAVFLVAAAGVEGQATNATTTTTTTLPPTTTTTTTPLTTTTTVPTTTSTSPTTTTTVTTTPPPTTTTAKPAPTPTPKPSPTPAPMPKLETGHWNLTAEGSKAICLRAQFAAGLVVPYETNDPNVDTKVKNASLIVPASAIVTGNCSAFMLIWPAMNGTNQTNFLTLTFAEVSEGNSTKKEFVLRSASATLVNDPAIFVDAAVARSQPFELRFENYDAFRAPVNNSFRCASEEKLWANATRPEVKNNGTIVNGHLLFKDVQVQPWVPETSTGFGAAVTCPLDRELTSDIVPIAVGCALAGLVVIVIVAYIIGRRRSRQSGYTSV